MADSLQGTLDGLSQTASQATATDNAISETIVATQTANATTTTSELDTTTPPATSTPVSINPSTDNTIPVLYGTAYVPGTIIDAHISNDSQTMYYIFALSEVTGSGSVSVDEVWFGDQQLHFANTGTPSAVTSATNADGTTDTNLAGLVNVWVYRERTTPIFGAVAGSLDTLVPGLNSNYQYGGLYVAMVSVRYDSSKGVAGVPQLKVKMTNSLSNPGAVWYDYMVNQRYGCGIDSTQVDEYSSINDSNPYSLYSVSDEITTYRDTEGADQTGPRYTINGLIYPGIARDNIRKINIASSSWTSWNAKAGKWEVVPNRPLQAGETVFAFNDSNITSGITVATTNLDSNYNAIQITYPETAIKSQNHTVRIDLADANPGLLNDNEPYNSLNFTVELVNNQVQATRIGLLELKQAREDITAVFRANYSALVVDAGDVISITNSPLGWNEKLFRVTRVREIENDDAEISVEIAALEYNEDVYTDESIDQFQPVANSDIPRRGSSGSLTALNAPAVPNDLYNPVATIPSFAVTATIPSNRIYDTLEFFISNTTAGGTYTYYDTLKPTSGVFQPGTTHTLQVSGLPENQYFFKVRAKIGALTTPLSAASSGVDWQPGVILNEQALATSFEWSPATVVVPTDSAGENPTTGQLVEVVLRVGTTKLNLSDATTDEDQPNNTWRVTNITYNSTNLVLSAPTYDTTLDRVYWTIDDLNSLQESLVITVRYKNSTGDFTDLGTTRVLATQLREGTPGSNSRSLNLVSSSNYFTRLKGESDSNTVAYLPATINLTAQLNNIPSGTVVWSAHDANDNPVTLSTSGATATLSNTQFGDRNYVVVHAEITYDGTTYFDEQTIVRLREGADGVTGITAFLTNEVAALPADVDGTYTSADLEDITSQIQIYAGTTNITADYTYTVESESGMDGSVSSTGLITITSVSQDLSSITIKAAKSGSASIYKTFVVVKQRRGASGSDGADGSTARLLTISSTSPTITIPKNGSISNTAAHSPASITYYAQTQNLPGVTITWTGQREGGSVVSLGTGTTLTLTATQIRDLLTTTESVRSATITATTTYAAETFIDRTSIQRVREGNDVITAYLTNEVAAVPCDENGTVIGDTSNINSALKVLLGSVDVTASATDFTVVSSNNISYPAISSGGVITFGGITGEAGSITVSAIYAGTTVSKIFSINKQRQGITGSARGVKLTATSQYFVLPAGADENSGTSLEPTSITFTASRINIPGTQAISYYAVISGVEVLQTGTPNPASNQFLFFSGGNVFLSGTNYGGRDTLLIRAKCSYNAVTYTDDYTISRLKAGASTINAILDNEVVTVAAATNNSIISGQLPISVDMRIFVGTTETTDDWVYSAANKTGSATFTVSGNTLTITSVPSLSSSALSRRDVITITATNGGYPTITKDVAVQVVRVGRDSAAQMVLSNEVHNFPASYDGVISTYSGGRTDVYVYEAGAPVTDWTYTITPSTPELTYTVATTGLPTGASRRITITGWSGTGVQASFTITASKTGYTSITKTFFLNRITAGAPGQDAPLFKAQASSQVVNTNASGVVQTPTSITLTGIKTGGLTGTPNWTVTVGTATLSNGSGNTITIATNTIATDLITVRGSIVYNGTTYYDDISIIKVADGATGSTGPAGNRGSRNFVVTIASPSYRFDTAYTTASVSGGPIPGDSVTETNAGAQFTKTYLWTGPIAGANSESNWTEINNIIDGNLLVDGTVRADAIYTGDTFTMNIQSNNYIAGTQGWSINQNGVAEFSNITARGNIEASGIYTGSTLRDKYVYDNASKDYPIYTTATRILTPYVLSDNTKPIPSRPSIDNYGAPTYNYLDGDRKFLKGPFHYADDGKEQYIGNRLNYADLIGGGSAVDPMFATSGSWSSGGDDKIENRVRRFLSTTDEIAFSGSISIVTNAPELEVFYYVQNDEYGADTLFNKSTTPFYSKIKPITRYQNPVLYRRLAADSGSSVQWYDYAYSMGRPGPWRVTSMSNVSFNGSTKLQISLEGSRFSSKRIAIGDTFFLKGADTANSTYEWAGALTTTGATWTPGTITYGVGSFNDWIGVKVISVVSDTAIILDCSISNASDYGSGILGFHTVGEQWINYSNQDILTNLNDVWTFNFSSKVKWSDFYRTTAPAFPTGGIKSWSLRIGVRAPDTHNWWAIDPYITASIQNL